MEFITLGTSHGATVPGRSCSSNLLRVNGVGYMFDCGGNAEGKLTDLNIPIKDIKCVFISHMHEDHVGALSSIAKRFCFYIKDDCKVEVFMPEEKGIEAFKVWSEAMHQTLSEERIGFKTVSEGEFFSDENVKVTAIPNLHMDKGRFPSYSYMVEAGEKKILYTGDLWLDFSDYPKILLEEEFDAVVCELVHFDLEKNLDTILKTKTKQMIFTHMSPVKAEKILEIKESFPFEVYIAEDGKAFVI